MGFFQPTKRALQNQINREYAGAFQPDYNRTINEKLNALIGDKAHEQYKQYRAFYSVAKKAMKALEKYIDPKNTDQVSRKIAENALSDLRNLSASLYYKNNDKTNPNTMSQKAIEIKNNSNKLRESARSCSTLIRTGQKIAGLLMAAAGIATIIASSAVAFFSFGGALPISAPLAGAGLSLSVTGILTVFGPSHIRRNLNKAAKIADSIAEPHTNKKRK